MMTLFVMVMLGDYYGERMLHHLGGFAVTHALISYMPEKILV
jgi:hypothetical protein